MVDDGGKGGGDALLGLVLGQACVLRDLLNPMLASDSLSCFPSASVLDPVPTQEDTAAPSPPSFRFETTAPRPPASCTIFETAATTFFGSPPDPLTWFTIPPISMSPPMAGLDRDRYPHLCPLNLEATLAAPPDADGYP